MASIGASLKAGMRAFSPFAKRAMAGPAGIGIIGGAILGGMTDERGMLRGAVKGAIGGGLLGAAAGLGYSSIRTGGRYYGKAARTASAVGRFGINPTNRYTRTLTGSYGSAGARAAMSNAAKYGSSVAQLFGYSPNGVNAGHAAATQRAVKTVLSSFSSKGGAGSTRRTAANRAKAARAASRVPKSTGSSGRV